MTAELNTFPNCPICGSDNFISEYSATSDRLRCLNCHTSMTDEWWRKTASHAAWVKPLCLMEGTSNG